MRIILGDLLTGRRILDVPFLDASASTELNAAGSVSATVDLRDPAVAALDLRNASAPGKTFLGAVVDDVIVEAGPVWSREYDRSASTLELSASGLWSYFDHRTLLPPLGDLPVVDPATGESASYANSSWSGLHLGTIGKRIVQQSMAWPGGNLPIVFEDDKPGAHVRTYVGAELPRIGQMLENITGVQDGPDIEFRPRWSADRLGVEWFYRSGDPRLASVATHRINMAVVDSPVDELTVRESGAVLGSLAWTSGARAADVAMVERVVDPRLLDAGYPLLELVDSSRSSVTERATLLAYSREAARNGGFPLTHWPLSVHTGGAGEPRATEFGVGDFLELTVENDPFIESGRYLRRVVNLSWRAASDVVTVGVGEVYG